MYISATEVTYVVNNLTPTPLETSEYNLEEQAPSDMPSVANIRRSTRHASKVASETFQVAKKRKFCQPQGSKQNCNEANSSTSCANQIPKSFDSSPKPSTSQNKMHKEKVIVGKVSSEF